MRFMPCSILSWLFDAGAHEDADLLRRLARSRDRHER
jgi:hypothetical protein